MSGGIDSDAHPASASLPARSIRWFLLALGVACFLANSVRYHDALIDDEYISFRYAKNLAEGKGLIFNPGERVEGYTNFSVVILAAAFINLGVEPMAGIRVISFLAAILLLILTRRLEAACSHAQPRPPGSVSILLLLPLQAFAYWAWSGMETMLFTSLFMLGLVLLLRERAERRFRGAAVVFVFLALTRPEGVFCFALTAIAFFVTQSLIERSWAPLKLLVVNAVVFVLGFGTYFVWRYSYFGDWLPNTFYAKVTGSESQWLNGITYIGKFALAFPFLAGAIAVTPLVLRAATRIPGRGVSNHSVFGWIALAYIAYVVAIGGDFMAYFRFFFPILPLACVLLASWLVHVSPSFGTGPRQRNAVWVGVWMLHIGASYATTQPEVAFVAHRFTVVGRIVGEWLAKEATPTDWIAVNTAGAVPYFSNLPAVDMLGLTDATIARRTIYITSAGWGGHQRGWGRYVLSRRPRFIFWYNMAGSREPFYLTDHELANDPAFRFFYVLKTRTLPAQVEPRPDAQRPVARLLGLPFGDSDRGSLAWPELGLRMEFSRTPLPSTALFEAPLVLNYFEQDRRDVELWDRWADSGGDIRTFLDGVVARWTALRSQDESFDPDARARVEALSAQAEQRLREGHPIEAAQLLSAAEPLGARAKSPVVYQYLANVAVLAGDLFMAVRAQKEALRLNPTEPLYRRNLAALLVMPYEQARASARRSTEPAASKLP